MKKLLLVFAIMAIVITSQAQNVGIGNSSPAEKLDVTGNIKVTGSIKPNGVDGAAGQILTNNGNGTMSWLNGGASGGLLCEYKNFVVFDNPGTFNWPVPIGVTKVLVEVWGGGAGGSNARNATGGGGGGYILGYFPTLDKSLDIIVGTGGQGGVASNAIHGSLSSVTYYNGLSLTAYGGRSYWANTTSNNESKGGGYAATSTNSYIGKSGQDGTGLNYSGFSAGTSVFENVTGGAGGNAGNTIDTGGREGNLTFVLGAGILSSNSRQSGTGKNPGGGGASGIAILEATGVPSTAFLFSGGDGANGRVIVYY